MDDLFKQFKSSPLEQYFAKHGPATTSSLKAMQVFGVIYGVGVSAMLYLTLLILVYPTVYAGSANEHSNMLWMSFYIMVNLYINYYLTYSRTSEYKPGLPTVAEDPTWNLCYECSLKRPPRAHHCPLCQKCILKRDHHCFFTACCIGFHNQRYFVVFNFYVSLGSFITFYFCVTYLYLEYFPLMSSHFYRYILPITFAQWLFGYTPYTILHVVLVMSLALMTGVGTAGFFLWQLVIILKGQTTHEFWKGNSHHCTSALESFRSVFGPYGLLNFIFPMPFLKTNHDGIHWRNVKNI